MADPLLGTEIGRYRLERLIGEGGMGQVYLGVQPAIGSRVAVKVLSDQCARDPELLERFFAEAKAVNLIRHENIVSVLDLALLSDGRPYIVMEFIEGQTLGQILRAGRAPLGGIIQAMVEVLSALGAAHELGIVHRDLKPDNVLITGEGHAKVLDFGIAKLAPGLGNALSPRTRTGALLGTPAYMAPEQISGAGNVDPRTDLYAAGIVLFQAVTGRVPFEGDTLYDLMRAHLEVMPQRPRELRPDLPELFEDVILQALAKNPAERFSTAAAMTHALQLAGNELAPEEWRALSTRGGMISGRPSMERRQQPTPVESRLATPVPAPPRSASRWVIGAAIAAFVVGVVLMIASRSGSDDATTSGAAPTTTLPLPQPGRTPPPPAPLPPAGPVPVAVATGSASPGSPVSGSVATPSAKEARHAADYDPRRFDPVAYLPKARALARSLLPDAELASFEFDPVASDGRLDLTIEGRDRDYEFRSPSASALPAGHPRNLPFDRPCRITIAVGVTEVVARILDSDSCKAPLVRAPKCSFAAIWAKARAEGVATDRFARLGWLFDEKWFFDTGLGGEGGGIKTFLDDC